MRGHLHGDQHLHVAAPAVRLEDWSVRVTIDGGVANACLSGLVYGDPRRPDGTIVVTSRLAARDGDLVVTATGTRYALGDVAAWYEQYFPGARDRLLRRLPQIGEGGIP